MSIKLPANPQGQAELILKGVGLALVKPLFFRVDRQTMLTEQSEIAMAIIDSNETLSDSRSKFGLPVFDDILFEYLRYTNNDGEIIQIQQFSMGTALCEVTQTRNIVATQIAGRNGTVKEYISDGDYMINIKGVLASQFQNVPPKESVQHLAEFGRAPMEIDVTSNFLAYFGIYTLVIKDLRFNQIEGQRNVIGFELSCMSDTPFEIKASKNRNTSQFL
jgi:hypothetical protein